MRPTSPSGSRSRGSRCPSWCCSLSPWRGSPWTSSRVCARHGWARALVHGTSGSPVGARIAAIPDAQVSLPARGTLVGGIVGLAERSNELRGFYLLAGTATGGLLGALLTFAPGAWYSHYNATTGAAGLSPLADQHLAGVVMWLIGAVPFALIGVVVLRDEG